MGANRMKSTEGQDFQTEMPIVRKLGRIFKMTNINEK